MRVVARWGRRAAAVVVVPVARRVRRVVAFILGGCIKKVGEYEWSGMN